MPLKHNKIPRFRQTEFLGKQAPKNITRIWHPRSFGRCEYPAVCWLLCHSSCQYLGATKRTVRRAWLGKYHRSQIPGIRTPPNPPLLNSRGFIGYFYVLPEESQGPEPMGSGEWTCFEDRGVCLLGVLKNNRHFWRGGNRSLWCWVVFMQLVILYTSPRLIYVVCSSERVIGLTSLFFDESLSFGISPLRLGSTETMLSLVAVPFWEPFGWKVAFF